MIYHIPFVFNLIILTLVINPNILNLIFIMKFLINLYFLHTLIFNHTICSNCKNYDIRNHSTIFKLLSILD